MIPTDLGDWVVLFDLLKQSNGCGRQHRGPVKVNPWRPERASPLAAPPKCQLLTMAEGLVCLSRSRRISLSIDSRMASLQARWQISVRSAPEKPLVIFARNSRSTS